MHQLRVNRLPRTTSNGTLWILGGLHGSGSTAKVEGYDPVIANVD